jgi:hypothetical protein
MPFARMELVRTVASPVATVRTSLAKTLRDLRFSITAERVTGFEGQRGSQLAAGALQLKKSPVGIKVNLTSHGSSTVVAVDLFDRWRALGGKAWGANRTYAEIFSDIARTIDRSLLELDPHVELTEPAFNSTAASVGFLERTNSASGVAGEKAANRIEQWLGAPPPPPAPGSEPQVVIAVPHAEAILDAMRVQGMLTVALLVARKPGSMPPALSDDVERVATAIERVLEGAAPGSVPVVELGDNDKPVVTFLNDQARIRVSLPLRTLQRCTTCRHEKVTNPDYKALVERNRKVRGIGGLLGASISSAGISPFLLVGRILPLVKMDPDYVCPRCQGLDADESLVVFCPHCGERRDEPALRTCRRCEHDFRTALSPETLWHPVGTAAALFAPPPPLVSPPAALPAQPTYAPGFYSDPEGRFEARWWDGFQWTSQVVIAGQPGVEPGAAHAPRAQAGGAEAPSDRPTPTRVQAN